MTLLAAPFAHKNLLIHCVAAIVSAQVSSWTRSTTSCLSAMMHILLPCFARHIWIVVNTCLCSVCVCVCLRACAHTDLLDSYLTSKPSELCSKFDSKFIHIRGRTWGPSGNRTSVTNWPGTCNMPNVLQTNEKKKNSINPNKISLNPLGCSDSSVSHFAGNVSVKQMAWRVKQVLSCTVSGRTILISHEPMINGPLSAEAEWMWIEANAISAIEDFSLTGVYIKLSFPCTSCNSGRSYKDMILQ